MKENDVEKYVIENNNPDFNFEKLEEELVELLEKLIKRRAKKNDKYKPPKEEIQQEMADVLIRINILKKAENWDVDVENMRLAKFKKLQGYIDSGKYVGTI